MGPAIGASAGAHPDRVAEREAPARFGVGRPGSARSAGGVAGAPLMFNLPPSVRLFIAAQLVDGRKGPDSLMTLVRDVLGQDIFDGHLFVFFTRRRDRVRIVYWDRNGRNVDEAPRARALSLPNGGRRQHRRADDRSGGARVDSRGHRARGRPKTP